MAVYKNYSITLDTVRTPRLALQNIVAGETGNKLTITLTNGGSTVSLNGTNHRVCLRVDSSKGTRRQDSGLSNSGISFDNGKAVILLSRDTFATGQNRACLEIFSTETETNDTLIVSAEFIFTAKKNDSGENAGAVYPSLIIAEQEAREATEAANDAADAANEAADALNDLLDNIDDFPTADSDHLVKSGGVNAFVKDFYNSRPHYKGTFNTGVVSAPDSGYKVGDWYIVSNATVPYTHDGVVLKKGDILMCNKADTGSPTWEHFKVIPVSDHLPQPATNAPIIDGTAAVGTSAKYAREDHVHPSDTSKQDVLTFDNAPTANSNNPVKSSGVHAALSEKSAFLGRIATIESAPSVSSYRIGDYFVYVGGDDTLPVYGTSGVPVKQFDVFVCKSCEGSTTNHTPIATPTWTDFCVLTGLAHTPVASNILPLKNNNPAKVGTSGLYARADHVHPSDDNKADVDRTPLILSIYDVTWSTDPSTGRPAFSSSSFSGTELRAAAFSSINRRPIMLWVESDDTPGEYLLLVEHRRIGDSSHMSIDLMSAYDGDHTYATATIDVYPSDDTQHTTTVTGLWIEI